jgi:[ribosomal protein S5]-alanine N-acetyltransferase
MIGLLRRRVQDLTTARLRLVAITPEMLEADEAADGSLAKILRAEVTADWPPEHWEPHVYHFIERQYEDEPRTRGWHRYVLVPTRRGSVLGETLIGAVGAFPKLEGDAEIGYSTIRSYQRQGYATEAARALVDWLLTQKGVKSVSAQTYTSLPESIKVMERCGMTYVGPGEDEGTVRYQRRR